MRLLGRRRRFGILAVALLLALTSSRPSSAVVCTFQGTGGSGGVNWGTATRWNVGGSGGSGTTCPPGPLDSAVFNTGSRGQVVDVDVDVGSITITSGFAGSITVNSGINMRVRGDLNQAARTLDASLGGRVDVGGDFIISGGTFKAPASYPLTIQGAFTSTGGTFTHSGGSVVLASTTSQTFASNGVAFDDLIINDGLIGYWKFDESASPFTDSSGWAQTATWSGSIGSSTTVPTVSFTDPRSLSSSNTSTNKATFTNRADAPLITMTAWIKETGDGAGDYARIVELPGTPFWITSSVVSSDNKNALGMNSYRSGTDGRWDSPANSITTGVWTHVAITYDSTSTSNNPVMYINGVSKTVTKVSSTPSGTQFSNVGAGYIAGRATNDRNFNGLIDDLRIYNRILSATEIATIAAGTEPTLGAATQTLSGNPSVASDLKILTGTLAGGSSTITVANNWLNYGTFTPGTSTVLFNGTTAGQTIYNNGSSFNNLTIAGTAPGAWTMTDSAMTLTGTLAISSGAVTAPAGLLQIGGAFNKTGGTFTHNSGQVMLNATSSQAFDTNGATFNNLTINDGLVGYWKLDEATGTTIADSSGYGNDGTLVNGPAWVTGASLPSLAFTDAAGVSFDGTNDYATLGVSNLPAVNGSMSIAFWMYYASAPTTKTVVALKQSVSSIVQLGFNGSGGIGARKTGNVTLVNAASTPASGWHHIAYTFNGTTHSLYVDGGTPATSTVAAETGATTTAWLGTFNGSGELFAGRLDDVRIYNRVLNAAEINSLALGRQPGSVLATQSMTGSPTVAGDLVIASGKLAAGTGDITLGGSWLNYGGAYTRTGSRVTFNGSGSRTIRSAGSDFFDVYATGAGSITLADNMELDPNAALYINAGTFDLSSYTLRTGDLNRNGAVTLTPSTGTVVLDTDTSRTLDIGTFYNVDVEPVAATNLKGYWKLDEGEGVTARDYAIGSANNGTLTNGPSYVTSSLAPTEFVNQGALNFDGTNDYVDVPSAVISTNAAFTACTWVNFTALTGFHTMVSIDGTNTSNFFLQRQFAGKFAFIMYPTDVANSANADVAISTTTPTTATWYHVCGVFNGTTPKLYVNGALEGTGSAVTGTWAASGHTILGAAKWTGSRTDYFNGKLDDVRIYDTALTATQIAALAAGSYPAGLAGAPTYTLGYDTTVSGTFKLHSGTFATGTYTMNASAAGNVASITGGTYSVGSAAQTFAGGLTVSTPGTLDLPTSGGTVKIGSTKTLNVDGTLSASSTGATIQTAGGASTYYNFNVGTSATATPTLNITGLAVKNTTSNGMYINSVAGSSTTFTNFSNIAFSAGTGSYLLRIYATSLALYGDGLSFDASTTSNLKLAGNGTGDGETRTYFGATCTSTPCESYDADDDSEPDGTGDTGVLGDEAVAQWMHTAYDDTAGSIQGFPTTAFDWNTFTYWNTYVVYRDFSGTTDRLFARDTDGAFKTTAGGAGYYWDLPSSVGDIIGPPRWTSEGSSPLVHYVYVLTTLGYVYKITDSGTAFTTVVAQAWPYHNGASATATSPLAMDSNNVYWTGNDGTGAKKMFSLTTAMVLNGSRTVVADVVASPALATISAVDYLFTATNGKIYRTPTNVSSEVTSTVSTSTVYGRVTVYGGKVFFPEDIGKVWGLSATDLSTSWSYQDTNVGRHASACSANSACTVRNLYYDPGLARLYFGDKDGHVYALTSLGAIVTNFPYRPGLSTDEFQTAPLYRSGVIVIGSLTGKVFVIDQNNGSTGPAVYQTFNFQSAVSTISYDTDGYYIIGTADGKLYYLNGVTDPTPGSI